MEIKIKYFGLFKEKTGVSEECIETNRSVTIMYLLDIIKKKYNLESNKNIILSLNQEYVKDNAQLKDGDEVGIMMPSSGG